jgi:HemY protein
MRALMWFLLLFALAVLLALLMGSNQPVVTIFWPPDKAIDFSLNFAVLALVALFLLAQMLLRASTLLRQLPQQARRWRMRQRERAMHGYLLDAMSHYIAGRFARARKSAQQALDQEAERQEGTTGSTEGELSLPYRAQLRALAHFMVAQGSHALQDIPERDKSMQAAQEEAENARGNAAVETREGLRLRAARWLLDDHAPQQALEQLNTLPQGTTRRIQALRLRLQAARQLGRTELALETGRALVRHKAFSPEAGQVLMTRLASDTIASACDAEQLLHMCKQLEPTERSQPEVALLAAQRMLALEGDAERARAWLLPVWELYVQTPESLTDTQRSRLFSTLDGTGSNGIDTHWLERIEQAHLRNPHQPALQYLMGMVCLQRQLWGKAQQLLGQAVRGLTDEPTLRRNAWRALAFLAEQRNDTEAASAAWKQAALTQD